MKIDGIIKAKKSLFFEEEPTSNEPFTKGVYYTLKTLSVYKNFKGHIEYIMYESINNFGTNHMLGDDDLEEYFEVIQDERETKKRWE